MIETVVTILQPSLDLLSDGFLHAILQMSYENTLNCAQEKNSLLWRGDQNG